MFFLAQIDRQLQTYLQRVEAVLGKGWEVHVEGQKLKQDGEAFRQKLNTQQLFEDWKKKVNGTREKRWSGRGEGEGEEEGRRGRRKEEEGLTDFPLIPVGGVTPADCPRTYLQHQQPADSSRHSPQAPGELCPRDHHLGQGGPQPQVVGVQSSLCYCEPSQPGQPALSPCCVPHGEHPDL